MDEHYTPVISEAERLERRKQRAAARRKKQLAQQRRLLIQFLPAAILVLAVVVSLLVWTVRQKPEPEPEPVPPPTPVQTIPEVLIPEPEPEPEPFSPEPTASTVLLGDEIFSSYAVLIDPEDGTLLVEKASDTVINPASMTKVLTLLVAAERLTEADMDQMFTMTIDITDYCFINECSVVGLKVGETVSVRELLYGTILPSGADASIALATYVAGSHEAFVELMNEKLEELGLSDTAHFTNCVGLYDENHRCSIYDMALIMKAAMENELCREVLNARTYETLPTEAHPDGQVLSNWFLRRIEDHFLRDRLTQDGFTENIDYFEKFQIVGGKTGYVTEAGSCAVSCGRNEDGKLYICATGDANSPWRVIDDHAYLYQTYCG